MKNKTALVFGGGGFIGSHMIKRLKSEGYYVKGIDLKYPEFSDSHADEFMIYDLTNPEFFNDILTFNENNTFDEIYQYAADMGGAGFIFTGDNDADIMRNSACINLNLLEEQRKWNEDKGTNHTKIFYSSSACMYPEHNQLDPNSIETLRYELR